MATIIKFKREWNYRIEASTILIGEWSDGKKDRLECKK